MADLKLLVDGAEVSPAATRFSLVRYEASYEGPAQLVVHCHVDWRSAPFSPDGFVELFVDGARVFVGRFDPPRPFVSAGNEQFVEFTARDLRDHAARIVPFNPQGQPSFSLSPGRLDAVLAEYLATPEVLAALAACGIDASPAFVGGAEELETFPVSLDRASLDEAMQQIAANAPGCAVRLDAASNPPRYLFVNLFGTPLYDVVIEEERLAELDLIPGIDGRAGAVQTLAGETTGTTPEQPLEFVATLLAGWPTAPNPETGRTLMEEWTIGDAAELDGGDPHPRAMVYRRFDFGYLMEPGGDPPPQPGSVLAAEVRIYRDAENAANDRWRRVEILAVDWEQRMLWLKEPALVHSPRAFAGRYNVYEPGRSRGATVRLRWSRAVSGRAAIYSASVRYPAAWFEGRILDYAPVRGAVVKLIAVPAGVDRQRYARQAHAAFSEPEWTGRIPLAGAMPAALWAFDKRVNLRSDSHGPTSYEALAAPIKGLRVTFAGGGAAEIELSRDTTATVREAAA